VTVSRAAEPTDAGRGRRRDEILSAAAGVFASGGYTNTSMREVAAASGILPGSLYHHFASKEAIAVELVEEYHAEVTRVVREFRPGPADPMAALRTFARRIAHVSFRHQAALQLSVSDAPAAATSGLKTVVHAEPVSLDRCWRGLIGAAATAGAIRPAVDTRILRHVLHRTLSHVALAWDHPSGPGPVIDCVVALILDGLATEGQAVDDHSAPSRIVDAASAEWADQAARERRERPGQILDAARTEFARRGFEATTMRDIADAAGVKASNLYRYFESKDSIIQRILGDFSDHLLAAYRDVIATDAATVATLDAILWLLNLAGRQFSREVEILQTWNRLRPLGVADRYHEGALARFTLLTDLIHRGVADGELAVIAEPALVASCLREIMWAPMGSLGHISAQRVRRFHRQSVLAGVAEPPAGRG
jgi:AcrR family transcriptional regulator